MLITRAISASYFFTFIYPVSPAIVSIDPRIRALIYCERIRYLKWSECCSAGGAQIQTGRVRFWNVADNPQLSYSAKRPALDHCNQFFLSHHSRPNIFVKHYKRIRKCVSESCKYNFFVPNLFSIF